MTDATTQATYCRICEAACGLQVELDAAGAPQRIRPDKQHPTSHGFVCAKGIRFLETAVSPRRLLYPQQRQADGRHHPITWDAALAAFRQKIRPILDRHGPHAVAIYFGAPLIHNPLGIVAAFQFARALGTRNLFTAGSQDNNNKLAASEMMHGSPMIHPIMDLESADLALLFGTNPLITQSSFVHQQGGSTAYDRFLEKGGRLVLIDPRRTESAQRWRRDPDDHLPLRPGSDIVLLLALLHELRDWRQPDGRIVGLDTLLQLAADYPAARAARLTGLDAEQIRRLARAIRDARRTTFLMGVGVNQGPFGALSYIAMQALAYLCGSFDQEGGLLFQPLAAWLDKLLSTGVGPSRSRVGDYLSVADTMTCGVLADEILTPGPEQIRALIVIAGNPLTSIPGEAKLRRALASLDLLVAIDIFANETAQYADLQLPGVTWLERFDLASWQLLFQQHPHIQYAAPVQPPPGEARTEAHILADLSRAASRPLFHHPLLARAWGSPRWNRLLPDLLDAAAPSLKTFLFKCGMMNDEGGIEGRGDQSPLSNPQSPPQTIPFVRPRPMSYLGRGPRTADGRVHFWHERLAGEPARLAQTAARWEAEPPEDGESFLLLGRRRRRGQNSWLHGGLPDGKAETAVWLAPVDMEKLGVEKGEKVRVATAVAHLTLPAIPRRGVAPGTAVIPHGLPDHNINALIPTDLEPVSGMHRLHGIRVSVMRDA